MDSGSYLTTVLSIGLTAAGFLDGDPRGDLPVSFERGDVHRSSSNIYLLALLSLNPTHDHNIINDVVAAATSYDSF